MKSRLKSYCADTYERLVQASCSEQPFPIPSCARRYSISPKGCHSQWHRRTTPSKEDLKIYGCDLTTASNMYDCRARTLQKVLEVLGFSPVPGVAWAEAVTLQAC